MLAARDRRRPKTTLTDQILKKARERIGERDRTTPTAAADKTLNDQPQYLLDRPADLLDEPLVCVTTTSSALALDHEPIDMNTQLPDDPSATHKPQPRAADH